jgi:hypothetical protein
MGWLSALIGALPALVQGIAAFNARRAELMTPAPATHAGVEAEDNVEFAKRRAAEAK